MKFENRLGDLLQQSNITLETEPYLTEQDHNLVDYLRYVIKSNQLTQP